MKRNSILCKTITEILVGVKKQWRIWEHIFELYLQNFQKSSGYRESLSSVIKTRV